MARTVLAVALLVGICGGSWASADSFGTGGNQFTIDFVTISGDASSANGTLISERPNPDDPWHRVFSDPGSDYRIGMYEVTNDQWDKFKDSLGVPVTGDPSNAYINDPYFTGTNVPTNCASWYEAAQFVNYLNTSSGHQAAYKFTGTQGTGDYTLDTWSAAAADNGTNLYRHKDAFYYLPTEDEWVKAAYWNGTTLQSLATKAGESLHQGDGISGTGWNYGRSYDAPNYIPWAVGSGSEELNGTYDMMGNVWEWTESPTYSGEYESSSARAMRGGSFQNNDTALALPHRLSCYPLNENEVFGFRVAAVPEPATLFLLALGGLTLLRRRT